MPARIESRSPRCPRHGAFRLRATFGPREEGRARGSKPVNRPKSRAGWLALRGSRQRGAKKYIQFCFSSKNGVAHASTSIVGHCNFLYGHPNKNNPFDMFSGDTCFTYITMLMPKSCIQQGIHFTVYVDRGVWCVTLTSTYDITTLIHIHPTSMAQPFVL